MLSSVHPPAEPLCRSTLLGLSLMAMLVGACSFEASKLRAPASRGQDAPADYPAAFETAAAEGGSGDLAGVNGTGGSTGTGADGAGAQDTLPAVDVSGELAATEAAGAPDTGAALDGGDHRDVPVAIEPDTSMDQGGDAEAGLAETGGAGSGGSRGTGGAGTGGTTSTGGAGGTVATGGAASGGNGGMGGAGGSSGTPVTYYRLIPQSLTTSSLEVIDGATANGTQVQMNTTAPVDKQAFALVDAGNGNVAIAMKADSGKCLGPAGNSTANNTLLEVQDCTGTSYQAFTQISNSGKQGFWFKNVRAGRCIDVKGGGVTNGALVQILDCNSYATSYNQYLLPQAM